MDYIIGTIIQYGSDTIPDGWLLCDGSAVSRTTYSDLFSVIGTTFGVGNGSTTFNLPDLRGKVGVGKDSNQTEFDTLGETGGEKTHTLITNEIPSMKAQGASQTSGGNMVWFKNESVGGTQGSGSGSTLANINGGGQAHNNLQPYQVTNYIIKALPITLEGTKISELNEATSINDNDLLVVVDTTNDETKKITKSNLTKSLATVYSTSEINTGKKWIDGKSVYSKVISFTTSSTTGAWSNYSHGISNIDTILPTWKLKIQYSNNWYDTPNDNVIETKVNATSVDYYNNSNGFASKPALIILEYTKTTD